MSESLTYQPMGYADLAARWNVSTRTVRRWIRPLMDQLGPIHGRLFTPHQVKIIIEHLE